MTGVPQEKNAVITGTFLGIEDHGIPTATVYLDYGGSAQGFGGYHLGGEVMFQFVTRTLEVVGVNEWEQLTGKTCRVRSYDYKVVEIGHFLKDNWYNPEDEMRALREDLATAK